MGLREKKVLFLKIFSLAEKKYGASVKRLAGEGWAKDYMMLIATIMSAQSRDETTIPIAERLFERYKSIDELANADYGNVLSILKSLNYNKTKAKNILLCAKMIVIDYDGKVPDSIEELVKLPGVGRKTANLVLSEIHKKDAITVDTHVHRICNVFGFVKTKNPTETEEEMKKVAPKKYWSRINRLFVLLGKDVRGRERKIFIEKLNERYHNNRHISIIFI